MISFDLDMTLLDHNTGKITPSALEAIESLRKKHKIVLATGRDMDNYYSRPYRDIIKPDAVIHMNGAKITVGDNLIFEHCFNRELLEELLCYCDREGYGIGMTLGDEDYYIHPEVIEASDIKAWGSCGRRFKDPWRMLKMNIRTLAFIGNEAQVRRLKARFPGLKMPLFAGRRGADVMECGISKAEGLTRLAAYFGEKEDLSDSIAFGDSLNDLEIIIKAGIGIAMGNAVEELKEAADYVTSSIAEDGIYRACLHFNLLDDISP